MLECGSRPQSIKCWEDWKGEINYLSLNMLPHGIIKLNGPKKGVKTWTKR
jgi:hypothetical protein